VIEDYVRWLARLYADRAGGALGAVQAGVGILRRHAARLPRDEDFVSLAAAEMADRLRDEPTDAEPLPPFLTLLDRSANAVRQRIVRAGRKRPVPTPSLEDVPDRPDFLVSLPDALTVGLSLKEHLVVQALLCGNTPDEVARRLGISLRTVYRRIEQIKRRLEDEGGR
jgi:DNA-binding CsgD family transcriptional regulator